eukprot:GFYU01003950.1.p1 GENE.GFYU01003950.1~~GFYU01003950.1.p1  ORF type:complete len:650 (+),score=134.77 GFYU01003950.1:204-2153(+)
MSYCNSCTGMDLPHKLLSWIETTVSAREGTFERKTTSMSNSNSGCGPSGGGQCDKGHGGACGAGLMAEIDMLSGKRVAQCVARTSEDDAIQKTLKIPRNIRTVSSPMLLSEGLKTLDSVSSIEAAPASAVAATTNKTGEELKEEDNEDSNVISTEGREREAVQTSTTTSACDHQCHSKDVNPTEALPDDMWIAVFQQLDLKSLSSVRQTCKLFHHLAAQTQGSIVLPASALLPTGRGGATLERHRSCDSLPGCGPGSPPARRGVGVGGTVPPESTPPPTVGVGPPPLASSPVSTGRSPATPNSSSPVVTLPVHGHVSSFTPSPQRATQSPLGQVRALAATASPSTTTTSLGVPPQWCWPALSSVDLRAVSAPRQIQLAEHFVVHCHNVRSIGCNVPDEHLRLLGNTLQITHLRMGPGPMRGSRPKVLVSDSTCVTIQETMPRLTHLEMGKVTVESFVTLMTALPKLQCLQLRGISGRWTRDGSVMSSGAIEIHNGVSSHVNPSSPPPLSSSPMSTSSLSSLASSVDAPEVTAGPFYVLPPPALALKKMRLGELSPQLLQVFVHTGFCRNVESLTLEHLVPTQTLSQWLCQLQSLRKLKVVFAKSITMEMCETLERLPVFETLELSYVPLHPPMTVDSMATHFKFTTCVK